ncbi:hypothetical protein GCM10009648_21930 [Tsukamurella spumae]
MDALRSNAALLERHRRCAETDRAAMEVHESNTPDRVANAPDRVYCLGMTNGTAAIFDIRPADTELRVRRDADPANNAAVRRIIAAAGPALELAFDFPYEGSADTRLLIPAEADEAAVTALYAALAARGAIAGDLVAGQATLF